MVFDGDEDDAGDIAVKREWESQHYRPSPGLDTILFGEKERGFAVEVRSGACWFSFHSFVSFTRSLIHSLTSLTHPGLFPKLGGGFVNSLFVCLVAVFWILEAEPRGLEEGIPSVCLALGTVLGVLTNGLGLGVFSISSLGLFIIFQGGLGFVYLPAAAADSGLAGLLDGWLAGWRACEGRLSRKSERSHLLSSP